MLIGLILRQCRGAGLVAVADGLHYMAVPDEVDVSILATWDGLIGIGPGSPQANQFGKLSQTVLQLFQIPVCGYAAPNG